MIEIKFCKTRNVKTPSKGHDTDAGLDFYMPTGLVLEILPGAVATIESGIRVSIPEGFALVFFNKSSIASAQLLVGAQVIDAGYNGVVHIQLHNISDKALYLHSDTKLVQGLLLPVPLVYMREVDPEDLDWHNASISKRGSGGFGSTGHH